MDPRTLISDRKNWKWIGLGAVVLVLLLVILVRRQHTSAERATEFYSRYIPVTRSSVDRDEDGIDDQNDILQSALAYCETRPRYKSKYYEGGYPTDRYGTCADVVAAALKGAGYDLMKLVSEDREKNPDDYAVMAALAGVPDEEPDPNIDFRRVRNLEVYFSHTAIPMTLDLGEINAWQGGDIVIFDDHIGIVSDRRSIDGVPYVIHHNSAYQKRYEQDILEARTDLRAHYRISQ
ncbi:MAG: DUF1287 domain-containing protein [Lachnospiraceae bacterium]|nr:DUF1287 domain-containing protein [Lachnospiraceae bacterium]